LDANAELMILLETITRCEPCDRVPDVPGIDPAKRAELMGRSYRAGWINVHSFTGDGTLLGGEVLMLTDRGRQTLRDALEGQDAGAAEVAGIDLEEKRRRRTAVMKRLYELSGANTRSVVRTSAIAESLGWADAVTKPVVRYLADKALVQYATLEGGVSLTAHGVDEVEKAMYPGSEGTDDLSGIHVSTGDVSGGVIHVLQGGDAGNLPPVAAPDPHPPGVFKRLGQSLWTVILGALATLLAAGITWAVTHESGHHASSSGASLGSTAATSASPIPNGAVVEYADNHGGSPVFANSSGGAVAGVPNSIPFGTRVAIVCEAPNQSGGMTSVHALYLIASSRWKGDYVVSDTMTNGGPLGDTNSPNVDPRVPHCH
jgi:hypothetical protein